MKFSAVILAGGQSRRMGRDKAWLQFNGRPLLAHQLETVASLEPVEVFISGRAGVDYGRLGCPVLLDRMAEGGPLAGVERALNAARTEWLLVLAVDMPYMDAAGLRELLGRCRAGCGVVPQLAGRFEPLAACYPVASHRLAESGLQGPDASMRAFVLQGQQAGMVRLFPVGPEMKSRFVNWNQPEDLAPIAGHGRRASAGRLSQVKASGAVRATLRRAKRSG